MKYNVIGDIHGRSSWKDLVKDDCINIFIGDYFSPYESVSFEECKDNFLNILSYAREHPGTILLLGNHCLDHYRICEGYSRQDISHISEISDLYSKNNDIMQMAFATENYLITHAGVTKTWANRYFSSNLKEVAPKLLAKLINNCWNSGANKPFTFRDNADYFDYYGTSKSQSCVWVRPETLIEDNIFKDTNYKQIVGHTQFADIIENRGIVFIDVLGTVNKSYIFNDIT